MSQNHNHWCSKLIGGRFLVGHKLNHHWHVVSNSRLVWCGCMRSVRVNGVVKDCFMAKGRKAYALTRSQYKIRTYNERT